jgi:hypothetical protein
MLLDGAVFFVNLFVLSLFPFRCDGSRRNLVCEGVRVDINRGDIVESCACEMELAERLCNFLSFHY